MNGILDGSKLLGLEPLTGDCHPQETTAFDSVAAVPKLQYLTALQQFQ